LEEVSIFVAEAAEESYGMRFRVSGKDRPAAASTRGAGTVAVGWRNHLPPGTLSRLSAY
jgi:hypothetical protein